MKKLIAYQSEAVAKVRISYLLIPIMSYNKVYYIQQSQIYWHH